MDRKIGILGGMGPRATLYFFSQIVKSTKAQKDSEHIPIIIYNNPKIPDRTQAIVEKKESPLPYLIEGARQLEQCGATAIVMPCITAHYYYQQVVKEIGIPFLHIIKETASFVSELNERGNRFGLLATSATVKMKLFQDVFAGYQLEVVVPDVNDQAIVMDAIYGNKGIKAGFEHEPRLLLRKVADRLKKKGVQAVIGGCTEIPLVLNSADIQISFIDPLKVLAHAVIIQSGYQLIECC